MQEPIFFLAILFKKCILSFMFHSWRYWAHILQQMPWWYFVLYAIAINLITVAFYYYDKQAAIKRRWRVPESTLHFLMFFGGTLGALYSQKKLRHKTRKKEFQMVFWGLSVFQAIIISYLLNA
ncbi:MAG: DUF1294 domain-containing protein [Alphaproteobacteria bacterium]|nr:MAG: DUF1294 domain-containing protein [Alphaproteobacteria bacterium]TAF13128.1 MAG: DUF1294 domain-containing protein [Alphaproteobacteria bacterium]TAF40664.1 MAG: DUF1294 domain-containing protein [Alphaproteobacteria bacterium]TAF77398.1 MAG: DUF1294 domain-containing protein [Alphaproteobacteria bacterium]